MTGTTLSPIYSFRKLISLPVNTYLSHLVREGYALAWAEPRILEMINKDQDALALLKKKQRIEDEAWRISQESPLPGFNIDASEGWSDGLELFSGRPRMPPELVLIFFLIRGYLGGFKDKKTAMTLIESKTIEMVLANLDLVMPSLNAILDNVNAVSIETCEFILDAQIRQARVAEIDDFKKLTTDSTDVEANSTWPTDSGTIVGLATRSEHLLRKLSEFEISLKMPSIMDNHLSELQILHKKIQLESGKKDSAAKRKKFYRKLFKIARKVRKTLLSALERGKKKANSLDLMPSLNTQLMVRFDWIEVDLSNLDLAIENASSRVLRNEKIPVDQKILSLSDESAAMIVKGGREPTLGYKPQIVRSGSGFVAAIIVPEGNAADSSQLRGVVDKAIKRTGIVPDILSFDDGYTNSNDREYYLNLGVRTVSFSGSKGKRLIPENEYDSRPYQKARNDRSAVESLIFTLKHNHNFDRVMRRGIENVRTELLEKAIVHNFFRMIKLRSDPQDRNIAA